MPSLSTPKVVAGPATSPRAAALAAALAYVAVFGLAVLANFVVLTPVLDGDPAGTVDRLTESAGPVRWATAAFLVIALLDVVAAWALYALLRAVHRDLALLGAWLRLGYSVTLTVAVTFLHLAVQTAEAGLVDGVGTRLLLDAFSVTWVVGLALFGVHLVMLGWLLGLAAGVPRALAGMLVLAGTAYVLDAFAHLVLADYDAVAGVMLAVVTVPSVLGELGLTVWLLLVASGRRAAPRPARVSGTEHVPAAA